MTFCVLPLAMLTRWKPRRVFCGPPLSSGQAGGTAVADVLFGNYNPAGRLPITFYKSIQQLPDYEDYSMKGRTYRFMTETPLYPFGYDSHRRTGEINKYRFLSILFQ